MEDSADAGQLRLERLLALERLNDHFGEETPEMKALMAVESGVRNTAFPLELSALAKFVDEAPESRSAVLRDLIAAGAEPRFFQPERLRALEVVGSAFGEGSPVVQMLLAADQESARVPWQAISEFIEDEGNSGKELVRKLVEGGDLWRETGFSVSPGSTRSTARMPIPLELCNSCLPARAVRR